MDRARTSWQCQRGGVLLAAAGVLLIVGLAYFALFAQREQARRLEEGLATPARLAAIDSALAQFVARQRRLPCPANGALPSSATDAGRESINLATGQCVPANQVNGVVPWVTLGLTEQQASDAWNGRITYRVQPSLASNLLSLMDMSWCDAAGRTNGAPGPSVGCNPAPCSAANCMHPNNFLYAKGLPVQDGSGGWLKRPAPPWSGAPAAPPAGSGAAYVLIAHGINGAHAFNANGGAVQAGRSAPGSDEDRNRNGVALTGSTMFIDRLPASAPGPAYFDDLLSHPTLAEVLQRAALGPRTH